MTRVVLDTNVFVSGLVFGGKPRMILEKAEGGVFELAVSQAIRAELEEILEQKFGQERQSISFPRTKGGYDSRAGATSE